MALVQADVSTGERDALLDTCEPLGFQGDPENVFRVVVVVSPRTRLVECYNFEAT